MTDATDRIARTVPRPRAEPRRRHVAQGSRIAAVGLGITTMFGLVAGMGYAAQRAAAPIATTTVGTPVPTPQIIVIHRPAGTTSPGGVSAAATPIPLTAQPVVRPAPAAAVPVAKTNGSN